MERDTYYCIEEKESAMLSFITDYKAKNGFSPTIREICVSLGIGSTSTVHSYLQDLIRKGQISSKPVCPRTMNVSKNEIDSNHGIVRANNSTIQYTFNLSKYSVNLLNQYCKRQGISADEALEDALQLLERVTIR